MAAVVETWASELEKLKQKIRPPKKPLHSKPKAAAAEEEEQVAEKETKFGRKESTMSEATVCLLMDRFAPW